MRGTHAIERDAATKPFLFKELGRLNNRGAQGFEIRLFGYAAKASGKVQQR